MTYAKARVDSMYGSIESGWRLEGKTMTVDVEIPPNTDATVRLPCAKLAEVTEGGSQLGEVKGIMESSQDGDVAVIFVGSGRYSFQYEQ